MQCRSAVEAIVVAVHMTECCRKSSQRALDELQRTIVDVETKYKAEIGRLKKKHESDVREFEIQVETLNRNNAELSKANKSLAARVKVMSFVV